MSKSAIWGPTDPPAADVEYYLNGYKFFLNNTCPSAEISVSIQDSDSLYVEWEGDGDVVHSCTHVDTPSLITELILSAHMHATIDLDDHLYPTEVVED